MDNSISSSRSSSNDGASISVQSPLPIRNTLIIHKNRLLSSSALFDFIEEDGQTSSQSSVFDGLSLTRLRHCHSEGSVPNRDNKVGNEQIEAIEAERGRAAFPRFWAKGSVPNIRPPSRARNPLVFDEEFQRMDRSGRLNGSSIVSGINQGFQVTERA